MPAASAASMTSASRTEPPGCTTAVTPASSATRGRRRTGRTRRTPRPRPWRGPPALADGELGRHDARLLARADADGGAVVREHDRVRRRASAHAPGDDEVGVLLGRRRERDARPPLDRARSSRRGPGRAPCRRSSGPRVRRLGRRRGEEPRRLAARHEELDRLGRDRRAMMTSAWGPAAISDAERRVELAGDREDAAERAQLVGVERRRNASANVGADRGPAGVGVLDDRDRSTCPDVERPARARVATPRRRRRG